RCELFLIKPRFEKREKHNKKPRSPGVFMTPRPVTRPGVTSVALFRADVGGLVALGASGLVVRDLLVVRQGFEAAALYGREMGEKILAAVIRGDESEALGVVEPLYGTCCHSIFLGKVVRTLAPEGGRQRHVY